MGAVGKGVGAKVGRQGRQGGWGRKGARYVWGKGGEGKGREGWGRRGWGQVRVRWWQVCKAIAGR